MSRLGIKRCIVFPIILTGLMLWISTSAFAYATCEDYVEMPSDFVVLNNGLEDVLYAYISVLWSGPDLLVESWEDADEEDREVYYSKREDFLNDLLRLYSDTDSSLAEMGEWYLGFLQWLDEFHEDLITPKMLTTGEVMYQLPKLETQHHTYMPIRAITDKTSRQWAFKPNLMSDDDGFIRYGEAYGIALGQYFGTGIGDIYQITFSDGQVILGVLTDCKAIRDTDPTKRYADAHYRFDGTKGNIVEFVMEDELPKFVGMSNSGTAGVINGIIGDRFPGDVTEIRKVGKADVVF